MGNGLPRSRMVELSTHWLERPPRCPQGRFHEHPSIRLDARCARLLQCGPRGRPADRDSAASGNSDSQGEVWFRRSRRCNASGKGRKRHRVQAICVHARATGTHANYSQRLHPGESCASRQSGKSIPRRRSAASTRGEMANSRDSDRHRPCTSSGFRNGQHGKGRGDASKIAGVAAVHLLWIRQWHQRALGIPSLQTSTESQQARPGRGEVFSETRARCWMPPVRTRQGRKNGSDRAGRVPTRP